MRVVGYTRVSTEEQGRSGLGLAAQRTAIEQECGRRGWELLTVEQDVASGRSRRRRPGLARAVAICRAGEAGAVVCAKLDRLARSVVDFAQLVEESKRQGWHVVVLDPAIDLTTPNGRLVAGMLAQVAQWEREIIGQRIAEALEAKRAEGWEHPNPSIPSAVREHVCDLHLRGMSQRAIAERLNGEGVPAVGGRWHRETVRRVLARAALTPEAGGVARGPGEASAPLDAPA